MDCRDRGTPTEAAPEEVMRVWVRECNREGVPIDPKKLLAEKGPRPFLPKRWIVERTFAWLRLVGTEQEDEQRLRKAAGEWRSLHLRSYESPDGEEIGSLMRLFRQFLDGILGSSHRVSEGGIISSGGKG